DLDAVYQLDQHRTDPLVGVNVSGLLVSEGAPQRFGLAGDYLQTMTELVRPLLRQGTGVLLVPHVHVPGGAGESDIAAVTALLANLSAAERARVRTLSPGLDAAEVKWCISKVDWFIGSRMHAT